MLEAASFIFGAECGEGHEAWMTMDEAAGVGQVLEDEVFQKKF